MIAMLELLINNGIIAYTYILALIRNPTILINHNQLNWRGKKMRFYLTNTKFLRFKLLETMRCRNIVTTNFRNRMVISYGFLLHHTVRSISAAHSCWLHHMQRTAPPGNFYKVQLNGVYIYFNYLGLHLKVEFE